jgi:hypothetical protein
VVHTVEYTECGSALVILVEVEPSGPAEVICADNPLISDNYPEYTTVGGECFAPTTTTTTTSFTPYRCIRLDGCDGFGYRDVVYNPLYETVGEVFQYYVYADPSILHCGTVTNNNVMSAADSSITNNTPTTCGEPTLCEVPNPTPP